MNKFSVLFLSSLMFVCSSLPLAHAQRSTPVKIEHTIPHQQLESGSVVTTVIKLTATEKLHQLTIYATPYSGLELIEGGEFTQFNALDRGDSHNIEVTISLTGKELGYLAIFVTTTNTQDKKQAESTTIRYGTPGKETTNNMRSRHLVEDAKGEKLILMQGSPR